MGGGGRDKKKKEKKKIERRITEGRWKITMGKTINHNYRAINYQEVFSLASQPVRWSKACCPVEDTARSQAQQTHAE